MDSDRGTRVWNKSEPIRTGAIFERTHKAISADKDGDGQKLSENSVFIAA
jgi:hypothetical protein